MFCVLESKWCKLVFFLTLVLVYWFTPEKVFYGWYNLLAYTFILTTALSVTCIFRNTKERIKINKKVGKSWFTIILSVLGILTTQVCGIGAPMCGAVLGGTIGLTFLPVTLQNFLGEYSVWILIIAIIGQIYSLYLLKCYGKNYCIYNLK